MQKYAPVIIVAIVVGVAGFFGGMQYSKSKTPSIPNMRGNFGGAPGQGSTARFAGPRGGAGVVMGEVLSKDATSITVKIPDGGSKIVFYSSSTEFMKTGVVSIDDVEVGKSVFINGPANSDGSVTAQSVQLGRALPRPVTP